MDLGIYPGLRETRNHGTAQFPMSTYEMPTDPRNRERIEFHWHDESELLLVTEGKATIHIDQESVQVREGDMVFVAPDSLHAATAPEGEKFAFLAIVFADEMLTGEGADNIRERYISPVREGTFRFPSLYGRDEEGADFCRKRMREIHALTEERSGGFELLVRADLLSLWHSLYQRGQSLPGERRVTDGRVALFKRMIRYLQDHSAEQTTLTELAKTFALSEGGLCHFFRQMSGTTVTDYTNRCRIDRALAMLKDTDLPVGEIAVLTGFNNISYFNRVFRREAGMTPRDYRSRREAFERV